MSMYQIEDFVENAIRSVATSDLTKQQKRNLIHALFDMESYGDSGFTNLRTINEMIQCGYSFTFDAKEMYNYKENPDLYDKNKNCYEHGDVYYDHESEKFCVDSGSKAWEEMVKIGAITGDGAIPLEIISHIDAFKLLKPLLGKMDKYDKDGFYTLILLTGVFDDMTEDDCLFIFGKTKEKAEAMLYDEEDDDDTEDAPQREPLTFSILGQACKFSIQTQTADNGDILLKGFDSEEVYIKAFETKVPFKVTITLAMDFIVVTASIRKTLEEGAGADNNSVDNYILKFINNFPLENFIEHINDSLSFTSVPKYIDTIASQYSVTRNIKTDAQSQATKMWCEYSFSNTNTQCDVFIDIEAKNKAFAFTLKLKNGSEITPKNIG